MRRFLRDNGLSLTFLGIFLLVWIGASVSGHLEEAQEREEHGEPVPSYLEYVTGPHFWQATSENWQSEWLQMASFVWFTTFLYQRGSPESKRIGGGEEVDKDPRRDRKPNSPWPVQRGGLALRLYEHSLTLALLILFVISWAIHAVSGAANFSEEQVAHGGEPVTVLGYVATSRFWFETFQNWQSEYLSVGVLVLLAIFLRQRGSSESKPVFASHLETGHS